MEGERSEAAHAHHETNVDRMPEEDGSSPLKRPREPGLVAESLCALFHVELVPPFL